MTSATAFGFLLPAAVFLYLEATTVRNGTDEERCLAVHAGEYHHQYECFPAVHANQSPATHWSHPCPEFQVVLAPDAHKLVSHTRWPDCNWVNHLHTAVHGQPKVLNDTARSVLAERRAERSSRGEPFTVIGIGVNTLRETHLLYTTWYFPLSPRLISVETNPDLIPMLTQRLVELNAGQHLNGSYIVNGFVRDSSFEDVDVASFAAVPPHIDPPRELTAFDRSDILQQHVYLNESDVYEVNVTCFTPRKLLKSQGVPPGEIDVITIDFPDSKNMDTGGLLHEFFRLPGFAPALVIFFFMRKGVEAGSVQRSIVALARRGYNIMQSGPWIFAMRG